MKRGISDNGFRRLAQTNWRGEASSIDAELGYEVEQAFSVLSDLLFYVKSEVLTADKIARTEALALEFLATVEPLLGKIEQCVEEDNR